MVILVKVDHEGEVVDEEGVDAVHGVLGVALADVLLFNDRAVFGDILAVDDLVVGRGRLRINRILTGRPRQSMEFNVCASLSFMGCHVIIRLPRTTGLLMTPH